MNIVVLNEFGTLILVGKDRNERDVLCTECGHIMTVRSDNVRNKRRKACGPSCDVRSRQVTGDIAEILESNDEDKWERLVAAGVPSRYVKRLQAVDFDALCEDKSGPQIGGIYGHNLVLARDGLEALYMCCICGNNEEWNIFQGTIATLEAHPDCEIKVHRGLYSNKERLNGCKACQLLQKQLRGEKCEYIFLPNTYCKESNSVVVLCRECVVESMQSDIEYMADDFKRSMYPHDKRKTVNQFNVEILYWGRRIRLSSFGLVPLCPEHPSQFPSNPYTRFMREVNGTDTIENRGEHYIIHLDPDTLLPDPKNGEVGLEDVQTPLPLDKLVDSTKPSFKRWSKAVLFKTASARLEAEQLAAKQQEEEFHQEIVRSIFPEFQLEFGKYVLMAQQENVEEVEPFVVSKLKEYLKSKGRVRYYEDLLKRLLKYEHIDTDTYEKCLRY